MTVSLTEDRPDTTNRTDPRHDGLERAWHSCADLYSEAVRQQIKHAEADFDRELLFCLLGGFGISYEHCRSATNAVLELRPFSVHWEGPTLQSTIASLLASERFEPRRIDGSFRKYRFPNKKALTIVAARRWLQKNRPVEKRLEEMASDSERRRFLCECPGLGPKTASWLLRNLGAESLAIIDVHVLRALIAQKRIHANVRMPKDYELAEQAFLDWCRQLNASPPAFDLFIWDWQRGAFGKQS